MQEFAAQIVKTVWQSDDGSFAITKVVDENGKEQTVKGPPPSDGLTQGSDYLFSGYWKTHDKYGRQFLYQTVVEHEPQSRSGVVKYLSKHAPNVGTVLAESLCECYGAENAIDVLRLEPKRVAAEVRGFSLDRAEAAAEAINKRIRNLKVEVSLTEMLSGNGFGQNAIEACIKKWGVNAPKIIQRDPFKLMLARIPGAGFARCDNLWHYFGHPPDRMKRQVMAVWDHLRKDQTGSTWHSKESVHDTVRQLISGVPKPERAVEIARRVGLLTQVERDGKLWVAETNMAYDEGTIVDQLRRLI